ncbi:hypothetical protein ACFL35_14960 [Candidatus Riflebacteria bacterium]
MKGTSFYDLLLKLQPYRFYLGASMLSLPFISWIFGSLLKKFSRRAASYFLALPVFLSVIPGICTTVALAYLLFFTNVNLLAEFDLLLGLGPIFCMIFTLSAISYVIPFDEIPGFSRLGGLMLTVAITFAVAIFISKTRIFLGFFTSFTTFIGFFLVLFILFHVGIQLLLGRE